MLHRKLLPRLSTGKGQLQVEVVHRRDRIVNKRGVLTTPGIPGRERAGVLIIKGVVAPQLNFAKVGGAQVMTGGSLGKVETMARLLPTCILGQYPQWRLLLEIIMHQVTGLIISQLYHLYRKLQRCP